MNRRGSDGRPDKHWVAQSFAGAAENYDAVSALQRSVGERLLRDVADYLRPGSLVLDVGSGTGYFAGRLLAAYPSCRVLALDLAEGMLRAARRHLRGSRGWGLVCGDAEALPVAEHSIDLIFSNLAIQWCSNLVDAFREFRRVLKPGGVAVFSTLGAGTLEELRCAWATVDAYSHVNTFLEKKAVSDALREAGFLSAQVDADHRCLRYPEVYALMRELKQLGARNVTLNRPRHLLGKRSLQKMIADYESRRGPEGIPAAFHVLYGYARKRVGES